MTAEPIRLRVISKLELMLYFNIKKTKTMKTKIILLSILGIFLYNSCDLAEEPQSFITKENFYKNETDALGALNSAYSVLFQLNIFWVNHLSGWHGQTDDKRKADLLKGNPLPSGRWLESAWNSLYMQIRYCNSVIDNVSVMSDDIIDPDIRNAIVAEAKTMRALHYFNGVRMWGPIPLRLNEVVSESAAPASIEEIYDVIITDLEESIPNLKLKGEVEPARITKASAQALLAKVYLYLASSGRTAAEGSQGNEPYSSYSGNSTQFYENCRDLCKEVLQSSYSLKSNWLNLWAVGDDGFYNGNREYGYDEFLIKALFVTDGFQNNGHTRLLTPHKALEYCALPGSNSGLGYEIVASYDRDDIRYTKGLIWTYTFGDNGKTYRWVRNPDDPTDVDYSITNKKNGATVMNTKKHIDPVATLNNYGGAPMVLLRMADVYLMLAESLNELGSGTEALTYLNAVRERCFDPSVWESKKVTTTDKIELRSKILQERDWELAEEEQDYFDLKRTGRLEEKTYNLEFSFYGGDADQHLRARDANDYFLPYPQNEVTSNELLDQR